VIRKILRYFLYILSGIILFVLIYLALSQMLPYIKLNPTVPPAEKGITIYIESNGVHTDFVMPVKTAQMNWNTFLPCSDFESVDSTFRYVAIGWGDKGFFIGTPTWNDLKFSTAFNAAFGLSSTAMHVTYKRNEPRISASCKRLIISEAQYHVLLRYMAASFQMKNGKSMRINHAGYSWNDCFYEANGTYSLFKTCNVWTGMGLKVIGVPIGCWTPFQGGIMEHL